MARPKPLDPEIETGERPRPTAGPQRMIHLMLVSAAILVFPFLVGDWRDWLLDNGNDLADYGIVAVALLGLVLAIWRFGVEDRQASAAEEQAAAAREQAEAAKQQAIVAREQTGTAERQAVAAKEQTEAATKLAEAAEKHAEAAREQARIGDRALLHDRYQRAARMLGEKVQAVRIGGVYLLDRLAREHPGDYHLEVMRLFASFVRHQDRPPADDALAVDGRPRADVQAVMAFIGSRGRKGISCEKKSRTFVLDLAGANLQCADLQGANLESANLDGARLERADLTGALLKDARVKGAVLAAPGVAVIGLTQDQLDLCAGKQPDGPMGCDLLGLKWRRPVPDGVQEK